MDIGISYEKVMQTSCTWEGMNNAENRIMLGGS